MRFVVGLGNPGAQYGGTRHNVGFATIGVLAQQHSFPPFKRQLGADISRGRIGPQEVMLIQPMTFMNLSGDAVGGLLRYYKGDLQDLIVIHDELDFEPGALRIKRGGGHGGHNGLRSIIAHGGLDFVRIRIGIGKPRFGSGADYVLGKFEAATRPLIQEAFEGAANAVACIIIEGLQSAMNQFNRRQNQNDDGVQ